MSDVDAAAAPGQDLPARRLTREQRREQVLRAAVAVVAHAGFAGATTDAVARAAGVSQPYVVRMFGGRRQLLASLFDDVAGRVLQAFASVPAGPDAPAAMGDAYEHLVTDRELLGVLLQGFAAGTDPEIGRRGRAVLGDIVRVYRDRTGAGPDEAAAFLAQGMLINVLLAVQAPEHRGQDLAVDDLTRIALGAGGAQGTYSCPPSLCDDAVTPLPADGRVAGP